MMHGHFIPIEKTNEAVVDFLRSEFIMQSPALPEGDFHFDRDAAYWAAELLYYSSQLLLNREEVFEDVEKFLRQYEGKMDRSAVLSADLTLRFLPDLIDELININVEDPLIEKLQIISKAWPYSMIAACKKEDELDLSILEMDPWLVQLFAERAVHVQNHIVKKIPAINQYYTDTLGIYKEQLIR